MSEEKGYVDIFYNARQKNTNKEEVTDQTESEIEENSNEEEFVIKFTNKPTKKIGDPIYFYVDGPNYQVIPEEWKQEIQFVPPVPAYIKRGGKYEPIDQNYYREHKYQTYYWIDGTGEKDCPACSGDGLILGDDNIEYTCPRCNGIGHLYFLTEPVPVKGIIVNLRKTKLNDDEDEEETLIIKYMASPPGTFVSRTLSEDELISEDEINEYLGKEETKEE